MLLRSALSASTVGARGIARAALRAASTVAVGDAIPPGVELHAGFPPAKFSVADRLAGRTVLLVGLPGAFTPT